MNTYKLTPIAVLSLSLLSACNDIVDEIIENNPPEISGTPPSTIIIEQTYQFTPDVEDADDDILTFTIVNKPAWLDFDATTGTLSGVPKENDIGEHNNIQLSVSDSEDSDALV